MTKVKLARRPVAKKIVSFAGVVSGQIYGLKSKAAAVELSPGKLIEVIRIGLPVQELDVLQTSLDMPMDMLAPKLGISKATLHRR